jgi:hypothetical protein
VRRRAFQTQIPSPRPSPRLGGERELAAVPSCARTEFGFENMERTHDRCYTIICQSRTLSILPPCRRPI